MEPSALMEAVKAPRRQSAKVAAVAMADQLDSDSEDAGSGGPEVKAEPSTRKGHAGVLRTYGKQTITRKRSATRKEDTRVSLKSKKARSPSLPESILALPASSFSASVSASVSEAPPRPRPRPRPVAKKPTPSTLPPLVVPTLSLDLGDLSDLTPLSSDGSSSQVENFPCVQDTQPIASTSTSVSSHPTMKPTSALAKKPREPAWTVTKLKTYVWVLIEPKSWRVYDPEEDEENGVEGLWWPGKIINSIETDVPLKVKLFGNVGKSVLIKTPSEGNILPKDRGYLPRFSTPTFISSYLNSTSAPKKKKQKLDRGEIEERWKIAIEEMKTDDEARRKNDDTDTDDFPEPTNMYEFLTAPIPKSISVPPKTDLSKDTAKVSTKTKRKRKWNDISETSLDEHQSYAKRKEEIWDEADDELDLPGELVLGRDGPSKDIDYWPAKLSKYIPPTKPNQAGKYALTWLDGTTGQIPRSWFYTMSEDEFAICKLGKFDSAVVEVQNDNPDEFQQDHDLARRSPSPIPLDIPPSATDFIQLPIRAQFAYTKTILKAIIDNVYDPSKEKHTRYMKGGKYRQGVVDDASLRGKMDPRDVEHLQIYIREWCLRDESRAGGQSMISLSSGQQNVIEIEDDAAPTNLEERREIATEPSMDDVMNSDDKRFTSPLPTEALPSSPAPMPPSSLPPPDTELEREGSVTSIAPSVVVALDDPRIPPRSPIATSITIEPQTLEADNNVVDLNTVEDEMPQPQSLSLDRQYDREDFKSLSALEKIDYCVNILLPEAVRQILLWRSGARTSVDLLSAAEEQDLYEQGNTLLQERDWVNDVIRYRKAMEKTLQGKKRFSETSQRQNGHSRMGSTSRPRRSIVIPNYQE